MPVTPSLSETFVAYAAAHGAEHDESWANPGDLRSFDPVAEQAALVMDPDGSVVGAASLMTQGYADAGLARFRILHCLHPDPDHYEGLVAAVTADLDPQVKSVFLFLPADAGPVEQVLAGLGFAVERRSFVLVRRTTRQPPAPPALPPGTAIRPLDPRRDAQAWCTVTNTAFGGQAGRFDATTDDLSRMLAGDGHFGGALQMAWRGDTPVGLVRVSRVVDIPGAADIEQVAVVPSEQGRGLGRALLRIGLRTAGEHGLSEVHLSTHATNRKALRLYTSEGFEVESEYACWSRGAAGAASGEPC